MSNDDNFDPESLDVWCHGLAAMEPKRASKEEWRAIRQSQAPQGKQDRIRDFIHYSEPDFGPSVTVWGKNTHGLFHNYADRLPYSRYNAGVKLAKEAGIELHTAAFYEHVLKHVHRADMLDLKHICIEGNKSNGRSILCFGYEYTVKPMNFVIEYTGKGYTCDLAGRPGAPVIGTGATEADAILALFCRMPPEELLDFRDQVDAGLTLNINGEPWQGLPGGAPR